MNKEVKKDNITLKSMGQFCSSPDKDGNVKCIPFEDYKAMSDVEKKRFVGGWNV